MDSETKTALADGILVAYICGRCNPNPGPGGCAFKLFLPDGQIVEKARQSLSTTNVVAEMTAFIDALESTPEGASVQICAACENIKNCFEKYLAGWVEKGWRKSNGKPVLNRELWEKIHSLTATRQVAFRKINASSNDPDSVRVADLAHEASQKAAKRVSGVNRGAM